MKGAAKKKVISRKTLKPPEGALGEIVKQLETRTGKRFEEMEHHFNNVEDVMAHVVSNMATKDQLEEVIARVTALEENTRPLTTLVTAFAARSEKYEMEHASFLTQTRRYEKWFGQLADATGVKLKA